MLAPWLNSTVQVQRRSSNPSRNTLNEPNYGAESSWPMIYTNLAVRIEYEPEKMQWTPTGERVNPNPSDFFMYVDDTNPTDGTKTTVNIEDRVTILTADEPGIIGKLYIVTAVFSEWDSMGNRHHTIAQMQVH